MHQPTYRHLSRFLLSLLLVLAGSGNAAAASAEGAPERQSGITVPAGEIAAWRTQYSTQDASILAGFPLGPGEKVDLELTRFSVTRPGMRFVVGAEGRTLDFDPASVLLLHGTVRDHPGSRAFLALSEYGSLGYVDLGQPGKRFDIASVAPVETGAPIDMRIRPLPLAGGGSLGVPMCGLDLHPVLPSPGRSRVGITPAVGVKHIELAIETDYELYELFGDLSAEAAYLVSLYAIVSDIFVRDVGAWVELSYVRLWDTPADLFNKESPIYEFRDYWELNMGGVQRDVAQFLSGRRDMPYGGIAFLNGLCNDVGYSVCGYALGSFVDPSRSAIGNRDITLTAHELGHNCGTGHTHGYGLDTCDDETTAARRGTIMSYCGQVFTGGEGNTELRFHSFVQEVVRDYLEISACVDDDCNQNGVADAQDIALVNSLDANSNGVPDECEDCNGNGTLDPEDIASGPSADLNGNGVPDECEPDCNSNGSPDALDIELLASLDENANLVPDECEPDCDASGTVDHVEINADMSLDLNRNLVLDACEDCDTDGTTDLVELDHANNIWITSLDHTTLREYLAHVGPLTGISDDAGIGAGQDLIITDDRRMLVSSGLDHRVVEFTVDGSLVGDLVAPGAGGLLTPATLLIGPAGTLLVASRGTDEVLEFDATTGAALGAFVSAASGGLTEPFGLAFGPDGDLYVTSSDNRVLRYDGGSGAFLGQFVSVAGGGGLDDPHGILFLPNGNLLVASYETNQILEYEAGTGNFVRQFNQGGTIDRLTLDQPWCMRLGPDGNVYVSRAHDHKERVANDPAALHLTNARVYEFDVNLGILIRAYILGLDSGVLHPTGFDFVPGAGFDCNRNLLPDECDIASGLSEDCNRDGIPDECGGFVDANDNGIPDDCEVTVYCSTKRNSEGCLPQIGSTGTASLTGPDDFHVTADDVIGGVTGYLLVGLAPNPPASSAGVRPLGPSPLGGRYCVLRPAVASTQISNGSPGSCAGTFDFSMSQAFFGSQGIAAGMPVYTQIWYRDANHADGSGVGHTAALRFVLLP